MEILITGILMIVVVAAGFGYLAWERYLEHKERLAGLNEKQEEDDSNV